ncbi:hypothetical protein ACFY71_05100 [Streptomyces cinerochromogenes]|uniref:Uncharacterized protein n=1 Tax=Streptomyces cinerochromogenes TaxID=66422 RepID=A0ABW7BIW5_9ACTN
MTGRAAPTVTPLLHLGVAAVTGLLALGAGAGAGGVAGAPRVRAVTVAAAKA